MNEAPLPPQPPQPPPPAAAEQGHNIWSGVARFSLKMVRRFKGEGFAPTLIRVLFARIGIWANERIARHPPA